MNLFISCDSGLHTTSIEGYSLDPIKMTEIGEHDWKIDNNEQYTSMWVTAGSFP